MNGSGSAPTGRRASLIAACLLFVYVGGLMGSAQFHWDGSRLESKGLMERDGYYHARLAQMFFENGISRSFPWTQESVWKERFHDKEFLFHVLMIPFTRDRENPVWGAQWFILFLGVGVFVVLYMVLGRHAVPFPLLFTAMLGCMGSPFLIRMGYIRSHVLSVLLCLIALHFLVKRNWRAMAVLGFVFAWSYTVPFVVVMMAAPFAAGRWLGGGGLDWRSPLAAAAGVVAGLIVHPYFPLTMETITIYWDVVAAGFRGAVATGVTLGVEINPYSTRAWFQAFPLLNLCLGALILLGWRLGRKLRAETLGMLVVALFWVFMTMLFLRFMEYAMPVFVLAAGWVVRDVLADAGTGAFFVQSRRSAVLSLTGAGVLLAAVHVYSLDHYLTHTAHGALDPPRFEGAARWMEENLEPGETVVNLWWDDFPDLYYHGHRQHYLVGLDPTYMVRHDREKADFLEAMRIGRTPVDPEGLARTFNARVMVMRRRVIGNYPDFRDRNWRPVYADEHALIFTLRMLP